MTYMKTNDLICEKFQKYDVKLSHDKAYIENERSIKMIQGVQTEQFVATRSNWIIEIMD